MNRHEIDRWRHRYYRLTSLRFDLDGIAARTGGNLSSDEDFAAVIDLYREQKSRLREAHERAGGTS